MISCNEVPFGVGALTVQVAATQNIMIKKKNLKFMRLSIMSFNYIIEANKKGDNQFNILNSQVKL